MRTLMMGMISTTRLLVAVWSLAIVLATAGVAYADDPLAKPTNAEAQSRLTAGNRLYRLREFEKAIDEYKAGSLKEDAPVFLYNLAQCYRQLGRYEDAIWHYERFIDRGKPTGQMKDAIDGFVKQMKDELAKKAMTQPPIEPAPDKPPPETGPKTVTIVDRGEPWYSDPLGWGLTGAGVVGVGVSLGLIVNAKGLDDDANSEQFQSIRDDLHERASTRRLIGGLVGVIGAAALVTGIVKLVVHPKDRERTVTTSAVQFGVARDGVFVMGRF